jgi:hypothetical protein
MGKGRIVRLPFRILYFASSILRKPNPNMRYADTKYAHDPAKTEPHKLQLRLEPNTKHELNLSW